MAIERTDAQEIEHKIRELLKLIGEDPDREGLKKTPKRVRRSYDKLYGGYKQDPKEILSTSFEDGSCDEMVVLKDIEFYSMCEHHMLPFFGKIDIGYIPNKKVIGVSKLARLVEIYARRLQIQERMTTQIAEALMKYMEPKGVIVVAKAQHMCMVSRGVEKQNSIMVTSSIKGVFEQQKVRQEFLQLTR